MGRCLLQLSYSAFYTSLILSLLLVGVCSTVFLVIGPPPSANFDIFGKLLFGSNVGQIIFLLISLILCTKKVKERCFLIFCEFGLLMSLVGNGYLIYNFQNFQLHSQKMQDFSNFYMKENQRPPPFLNFLQNTLPCCGTTSFQNYANGADRNLTVPESCCVKVTPNYSQNESSTQQVCTGQVLDLFYYMMKEDIEKEAFDKFVENKEELSTMNEPENPFRVLTESSSPPSLQSFTSNYKKKEMMIKWMTPQFYFLVFNKMKPFYELYIRSQSEQELRQMTKNITKVYTKCEIDGIVDMAVSKLAEEDFNKTYSQIINEFTSDSTHIHVLGCHQFLEHVEILQSILIGRYEFLGWMNRYFPLTRVLQNWKLVFYYFLITLVSLNTLVFLLFNVLVVKNNCCSRNHHHHRTAITSFDSPT